MIIENHTIDPGSAVLVQLDTHDVLRIIDIHGSQVSDVIAVNQADYREQTSPAETLNMNFSFVVPLGGYFYTNFRRPAFELIRDDSEGVHDLTNACCSREFYIKYKNDENHPNCRDSLAKVFQEKEIEQWELQNPINIFQPTVRGPSGDFAVSPTQSSAGDAVELEALMDLIVGVSCCPSDVNGSDGSNITGSHPTPIKIELLKK